MFSCGRALTGAYATAASNRPGVTTRVLYDPAAHRPAEQAEAVA
ncbi:hypothetical protein ACIRD9_11515 [Streptomyces violaceus]